MQTHTLLILPTQLFEKMYIQKQIINYNIRRILIYEHPHYFNSYKYNKKKILLHKASLDYYNDYLQKHFPTISLEYIPIQNKFKTNQFEIIYVFDPIDKIYLLNFGSINYLNSPSVLMSVDQCHKYKMKYKRLRNNLFYKFVCDNCELLQPFKNLQSFDKQNRKRMPKNMQIQHKEFQSIIDKNYIEKSRVFVDTHYNSNIGNTNDFRFAVTHKGAKMCLKRFLVDKLIHFGDYQDFIKGNDQILFHSSISMYLNIGLLTPEYVIKQLIKFTQQNTIAVNNIEAFIRQIAGWREFQRICYLYADFNNNYFQNNTQLNHQYYTGNTGISIVDDAIQQSINTGYNHHIVRLMILANFFNLQCVKPVFVFQWFMEVFIDSYEWVMCQNVYSMGLYSDKGQTSTKPYLCSSNYLLKMSDYGNSDGWAEKWDKLLYDFIQRNKERLKYIYGMNWIDNYIKKYSDNK